MNYSTIADWAAVEAIATVIAAVAALIAVVQSGRKSRFASDAARADVTVWIVDDYDNNRLREGADLTVTLRNDSRSQVRIEMLVLRPRFVPSTELIDPNDAFHLAEMRRKDPVVWDPRSEPLAAGEERSIIIPRSYFDSWDVGAKNLFSDDAILGDRVNPWIGHLVASVIFTDNTGQLWARLRSGRLKKMRDVQHLYSAPFKRALPDG